MKYLLSFFGLAIICFSIVFFGEDKTDKNDEYLRIHIIANSSNEDDQIIKYNVKDKVVEFLGKKLESATTKEDAKKIICENLIEIEDMINCLLMENGFQYCAECKIVYEQIPTRSYTAFVLEAGEYESLQISLGEANGDNWWCVIFPDVCFSK